MAVVVAPASGGVPAPARALPVGYNADVQFDLEYTVKWSRDTGSQGKACSSWSHAAGKSEFVGASSTGPKGRHLLGRVDFFPKEKILTGWGTIWAAGSAKMHVERTLTEASGSTACGTTAAKTDPTPANDCGERDYSTKLATVRNERRASFNTLEQITSSRLTGESALSVTVIPLKTLFRTCRVSSYVQDVPGTIGVELTDYDLAKLRNLKAGARYAVSDRRSGQCARGIAAGETCRFELDINVEIRRLP